MIYGSIWAHMAPYGWPEVKKQRGNVKIIISDSDLFRGVCPGDWEPREIQLMEA